MEKLMPTLEGSLSPTLADILLPRKAARSWWTEVALCAQVSIPLPFTPVPITGQTFAVLFTGAVLGGRRGVLALLLYLAWGAMGLPVFAGGAAGIYRFFGPTGGYLIAYPLAAGLVGALAERGWDRNPHRAPAMMLTGNFVISGLGVLWLARFTGGLGPALVKGLLPFLPGDLVKMLLASLALPGGWMLVRRIKGEG
jgi:biotin transport system substrate-specific component